MSELRERIIDKLKVRREKVLNGGINCIPLPFKRFREDFPGIEQGRLYLISGGTKSAKSMITNYLFVINTIMYCYYNPGKITPKIFYFPLEEDKDEITLKIMSFILAYITNNNIIISPTDLKSTDASKPLSQEVLDLMHSKEFIDIMNLYEQIVTFYDEQNRVGIYKILHGYAKSNGTIHTKTMELNITDEFGVVSKETREVFDYYVPNNPEEYVIAIVDHVSLLNPIKGEDLRLTISNFAEDCIRLRNNFNMSFAIVQQQNIESTGLDAFKADKLLPTVAGLADCKDFGKAANMMLGILNPHYFEKKDFYGYDISVLKGMARFLQITINRNGISNGICPLLFIGECSSFKELPLPNDKAALDKIYEFVKTYKKKPINLAFFTFNKFNKQSVKSIINKYLYKYLYKYLKYYD